MTGQLGRAVVLVLFCVLSCAGQLNDKTTFSE
jgi:hypothetical protein